MEPREILAWVLAGLALLGAGIVWATRTSAPAPGVMRTAEENRALDAENRRLESTVSELRGEQMTLRGELDRLLQQVRSHATAAAAPSGTPPAGTAPPGESAPAELGTRAHEAVADLDSLYGQLASGTGGGMKGIFDRISQLQAMGPEALPAMKDAFRDATDPGTRRVLASIIATRGGPEEQQFLIAAAERETEPAMKEAYLSNASMMGGEGKASAQAGLGELMKAQDPQARAQALRGMVDLSDPGVASAVQSTLASDPNEDVRLAAFGALIRAGETRDEAYRMALADPSPRVREIAECRQRLEQVPGL